MLADELRDRESSCKMLELIMALLVMQVRNSTISLGTRCYSSKLQNQMTWSKHPKNEDGSWKSHLIQVTEFDA